MFVTYFELIFQWWMLNFIGGGKTSQIQERDRYVIFAFLKYIIYNGTLSIDQTGQMTFYTELPWKYSIVHSMLIIWADYDFFIFDQVKFCDEYYPEIPFIKVRDDIFCSRSKIASQQLSVPIRLYEQETRLPEFAILSNTSLNIDDWSRARYRFGFNISSE